LKLHLVKEQVIISVSRNLNMEQTPQITVIIADDHDIYRDGLFMLLTKDPLIRVLGDASNGKQLIRLFKESQPDIVLTDLRMPELDGVSAIREMVQLKPGAKIIALSTFDSDTMVTDALEAGAMGYIVKNAERGEITEAIRMVYAGNPYYCKTTSNRLVRLIAKSDFNPYNISSPKLFSDKEREIIKLICEEKTSKEIGELLFMSPRTVEGHRTKILEKMNVKTTAGIAIYALKNGFYHLED
jgi:two-component system response regulator NreC